MKTPLQDSILKEIDAKHLTGAEREEAISYGSSQTVL